MTRYSVCTVHDIRPKHFEDSEGPWVRYADVAALLEKVEQIEQEMRNWILASAAITAESDAWDQVRRWADVLRAGQE